jgi:hypothetical protein
MTWTVEIPEHQTGAIVHPATRETLRASDGWTLKLVEQFAAVNGGRVVVLDDVS